MPKVICFLQQQWARSSGGQANAPIEHRVRLDYGDKNKKRPLLGSSEFIVLLVLIVCANIFVDVLDLREKKFQETANPVQTHRLGRGLLQLVAVVAAADSYSDASAESPSVEAALEDEDDDDEELDGAASNEYPDGDNDNDNDESYEDADDDRQESRIRESWSRPGKSAVSYEQRKSIAAGNFYAPAGIGATNGTATS